MAIIGSGISGLSTAYHLHPDFDVTVFEKQGYLGGHTDTHKLEIDKQTHNIDSGFIIYCPEYYPHFNAMIEQLGVDSQLTNMSFAARNQSTDTIYNSTNINRLFCQRRNIVSPRFWRMLFDITRFYRTSPKVLKGSKLELTTGQYLSDNKYGDGFVNDHLLPMISALWSTTPQRVLEFPIFHLVAFFQNHGLLKLIKRPDWRVICNGSASYVNALVNKLKCRWELNVEVKSVRRDTDGVTIGFSSSQSEKFDAVVFACHADQALQLIHSPSDDEVSILGAIPFENNSVVVHTDESIMHSNKLSWASWNTEVPDNTDPQSLECCTANYWMNLLQGLSCNTNVFTSLNSYKKIDAEKILTKRQYSHPIFTASSVAAQKQKHLIDGKKHSYFVGAYWGWGFHEDGARSAFEVSQLMKGELL